MLFGSRCWWVNCFWIPPGFVCLLYSIKVSSFFSFVMIFCLGGRQSKRVQDQGFSTILKLLFSSNLKEFQIIVELELYINLYCSLDIYFFLQFKIRWQNNLEIFCEQYSGGIMFYGMFSLTDLQLFTAVVFSKKYATRSNVSVGWPGVANNPSNCPGKKYISRCLLKRSKSR